MEKPSDDVRNFYSEGFLDSLRKPSCQQVVAPKASGDEKDSQHKYKWNEGFYDQLLSAVRREAHSNREVVWRPLSSLTTNDEFML